MHFSYKIQIKQTLSSFEFLNEKEKPFKILLKIIRNFDLLGIKHTHNQIERKRFNDVFINHNSRFVRGVT